jgi:hypothetical protein
MTTTEHKKAELLDRLQTAVDFEMATIPAYMTALLSIKRPSNRGVAENIRSVMMEEMLHLALVSNVISSIGGKVKITGDRLPHYPLRLTFKGKEFADRQFNVDLVQFSKEAIKTFMAIEQPRAPKPVTFDLQMKEITLPERTIGEFYDKIIGLLEDLHGFLGPKLFVGDPNVQISEDYYWSAGGKPILVRDLASAKAAMQIVIEQGEGTEGSLNDGDDPRFWQPFEVAHYYRFREIYFERRYARSDNPLNDPSGEPLSVDYASVYPIKANAKGADYSEGSALAQLSDAFNRQYTRMLIQLEEALNGNPKTLYTAIMNGMPRLSDLGIRIMATRIAGDKYGLHGCPTFEWIEP